MFKEYFKTNHRLFNWKFKSAVTYLTDDTPGEVKDVTRLLASQFGNCGHFRNICSEGSMAEMVHWLLLMAGVDDE